MTIAPPDHPNWIQTYSGVPFDLVAPKAEHVSIYDIATALSKQCRWSGQIKRHFSVAQHSMVVADLLAMQRYAPGIVLQGLLHDAAEAYIVDVPAPLKDLLPEYRIIEQRIKRAVAQAFNLPSAEHPAVKLADETSLSHESRHLLPGGPQHWDRPAAHPAPRSLHRSMTPDEAESEFLSMYYAMQHAIEVGGELTP